MSDEQTYELAHIVGTVEELKAESEAADQNLQEQIDGLVMLSAAGEWLVRIGGSNPPAGEMIINSMEWDAVTFIWMNDEDQAGTTHNFDFLDPGDRIRITQGDSFGSYRVLTRDDSKAGAYVTVVPVLTGLAGSVTRDENAALTLEDSNGSGSGGGGGSHTHSEYTKLLELTQAEYDALGSYDDGTVYVVIG